VKIFFKQVILNERILFNTALLGKNMHFAYINCSRKIRNEQSAKKK
jgi:hypothetical protein